MELVRRLVCSAILGMGATLSVQIAAHVIMHWGTVSVFQASPALRVKSKMQCRLEALPKSQGCEFYGNVAFCTQSNINAHDVK